MKSRSMLVFIAVGMCIATASAAAEIPPLKPGLWEMRFSSSAGGVSALSPTTVCVGAKTSAQREVEEANVKSRCETSSTRVVGGQRVFDAVCSTRGMTVTMHHVTSLNGDTFHEENSAMQGSSVSDGKWVGPCKPGQLPQLFK